MTAMAAARSAQRRVHALTGVLVAVALTASCAAAGNPSEGPPSRGSNSATIAALVAESLGASSRSPGDNGLAGSSGSSARTASQPVPPDLAPPASKARQDLPPIYFDGCHLAFTATTPQTCAFGDIASRIRVVLIGDSSAAQWFPALQGLAVAHHWRLESVTKSACTIADIAVWQSTLRRRYTECAAWRSLVLKRIRAERPALVIASTSHAYQLIVAGHEVPMTGHEATYQAALTRTLRTLKATSLRVVLLGMTPDSRVDPPVCVAAHLADARACATPSVQAVDGPFRSLEMASGASAGARWIDPTSWVCPLDPCPAIVGQILVYRDPAHLTATFAASLRARLEAALPLVH